MKTIKQILVAVVVLALCSCNKTEYLKVIPAEANVVMSIDVKSLSEKSDFAKSHLMSMMQEGIEGQASNKQSKEMKKYIDDPMSMGIDWRQPLYMFVVGNEAYTAGCVAKVNNKDDLNEFFTLLFKQGIVSKPKDEKGFMCGTTERLSYAFDDNTLLMCFSDRNEEGEKFALELMEQDEDKSFLSTEAFDKMENVAGQDVVCYLNMGLLPDYMAKQFTDASKVKPQDLALVSGLDFSKGAATLTTKLWGQTETAQKLLDKSYDGYMKMEGCYVDEQPDDVLFWMGMGIKGEPVLKQLKKNKQAIEALFMMERAVDIEQMLRSVEGDVALSVSSSVLENMQRYRGDMPEFSIKARLKNDDFLKDVEDWKENMGDFGFNMQTTGKKAYLLSSRRLTLHWGVDDKDLYFATPKAYQQMRDTKQGSVLQAYKKEIKHSKVFAYLNLQEILKQTKGMLQYVSMVGVNLNDLKAVVMKSDGNDELVIRVEMDNDDENFLKQLIQ